MVGVGKGGGFVGDVRRFWEIFWLFYDNYFVNQIACGSRSRSHVSYILKHNCYVHFFVINFVKQKQLDPYCG